MGIHSLISGEYRLRSEDRLVAGDEGDDEGLSLVPYWPNK